MKKILLFILFLTSCRSITAEDYKTTINLPEQYNLSFFEPEGILTVFDTSIGDEIRIDNEQKYLLNVIKRVDKELTIANRAEDSNEQLIATVVIDAEITDCPENAFMRFLAIPSFLSLSTINLLGIPAGSAEYEVILNANIYDLSYTIVKKFQVKQKDWAVHAYYYGYAGYQTRPAALLGAYKKALKQITDDIYNDKDLQRQLMQRASKFQEKQHQNKLKKKAEEAKKKAIEQEAKRKKEAEKQEYLKNVLDELNDI